MTGTIKAVIRKREDGGQVVQRGGYFFISAEDGSERFAHASNLEAPATFPGATARPSDIREGMPVEFDAIEIPGKGLRADRVKVL